MRLKLRKYYKKQQRRDSIFEQLAAPESVYHLTRPVRGESSQTSWVLLEWSWRNCPQKSRLTTTAASSSRILRCQPNSNGKRLSYRKLSLMNITQKHNC